MNLRSLFRCLGVMLFLVVTSATTLWSQSTPAPQGKVVVVVLDVSGSIRPYFATIRSVLDQAIVEKRLKAGDYFVLIPFGDDARPMYSGQLLRDQDTESIINSLAAMKADDDYTDIGSALKVALDNILTLKGKNFNLYEPLVLFLSDGNHQPGAKSPFKDKTVDQIFQDPVLGDKSLYSGWYFIGIGANLKDIRRIAELSGRGDYLLTIEDLSGLEAQLDRWINAIPAAKPLEPGEVRLERVELGGVALQKVATNVPLDASNLDLVLQSTYQKTPAIWEFGTASALFQTEDRATVVPVSLNLEAGAISVAPGASRASSATFHPQQPLSGKGVLKVTLEVKVNHVDKAIQLEYPVEFLSPAELLFRAWMWPVVAVLIVGLLVLAFRVGRGRLPVRVTLEIQGKPVKSRPVPLRVGKKADFGTKPGLAFKLDHAGAFAPLVGTLERTGKSSFRILPKDPSAFSELDKLKDWTPSSPLKLVDRNRNDVVVRFRVQGSSGKKR